MRKFGNTAGDDLENLISVAGEGAQRLQGMFFPFFFIYFDFGGKGNEWA